MSNGPSLNVTPSKLGFVLSILAVLTFGWQSMSYLNQQDYRITALEAYQAENKQLTHDMLAELKHLNEAVTKLSAIMERADLSRNDSRGVGQKRAERAGDRWVPFAQDRAKLEFSANE